MSRWYQFYRQNYFVALALVVLLSMSFLGGCVGSTTPTAPAATNSNSSQVTASQNAVGAAYTAYDAAAAAWIVALTAGKMTKATVTQGESYRAAAYSALASLKAAASSGNTAVALAAFDAALNTYVGYMSGHGISVPAVVPNT